MYEWWAYAQEADHRHEQQKRNTNRRKLQQGGRRGR